MPDAAYCVNHPGFTASHTADMPSAAPPYRQDVPLCSACAGRIERIGFAVKRLPPTGSLSRGC